MVVCGGGGMCGGIELLVRLILSKWILGVCVFGVDLGGGCVMRGDGVFWLNNGFVLSK